MTESITQSILESILESIQESWNQSWNQSRNPGINLGINPGIDPGIKPGINQGINYGNHSRNQSVTYSMLQSTIHSCNHTAPLLKWRKSASHPQAGLGRLAQRAQRLWCEALFLHLGLLQNPWVGSIWHFRTCNGGSKFLTLDANSMEPSGPISKFQSPGVIILIGLSISTLTFASGTPGIQQSDQFWTILG